MRIEDAEDLWLCCVMQAPAYADHSLVSPEHLSSRANQILEQVKVLAAEWPMVLPDMLERVDLRTIPRRIEEVDAETTIQAAERALLDAWAKKTYAEALGNAARVCEVDGPAAADRILDEARKRVGAVNSGIHWEHASEAATALLDGYERVLNEPEVALLGSGMEAVDRAVKNWPPRRMTVVGGYTNEGKSTFVLQLLTGMASRSNPCCYINLEDESMIPAKRQLSTLAEEVEAVKRLAADDMSQADIDLFRHLVRDTISVMPLHYVTAIGWGIERVCYAIQDAARRHGCKVCAVDYLQCFETTGEQRSAGLGARTRQLKAAAASVGMHLILVSQLVRPGAEGPRSTPPRMNMFKESGDIENSAEYAMCVWRPEKGSNVLVERAKVLVDKSKDGKAGAIDVGWDTRRHIFTHRPPDDAADGQHEIGEGGWSDPDSETATKWEGPPRGNWNSR